MPSHDLITVSELMALSFGQSRHDNLTAPMPRVGRPGPYEKRHCLAVGINQYEHWPRLGNAVHDAMHFAAVMRDDFGFTVKTLIDSAAASETIQEEIVDNLRRGVGENDLAVMFFAGHGHTERLPNGRDRGYVVPVNAREQALADLISMDDIASWTEYLRCRHVLWIFDSCFSGTATVRSSPSQHESDMLQRKARLVITAGGADQQVTDGGWSNHSVFTGLLLLGLIGENRFRSQDTITATELFGYLAREVPNLARQTPAIGCLPGHEGGDILLSVSSGKTMDLPISPQPPPSLQSMSSFLPGLFIGCMTRSNIGPCSKELPASFASADVGEGVTLFAERGRQWAIVIGTNPGGIPVGGSDLQVNLCTEYLDAADVAEWFLNPDLYGSIPSDQFFFRTNEFATGFEIDRILEQVSVSVDSADSVLFYFSGHATEFGDPGELLFSDAFEGRTWAKVEDDTPGILPANRLVEWCNKLDARKVVCILDSGGPASYKASRQLTHGRYFVSSVNSRTMGRNGIVTWYVRRAVQKLGTKLTVAQMGRILNSSERFLLEERMLSEPLYTYVAGVD